MHICIIKFTKSQVKQTTNSNCQAAAISQWSVTEQVTRLIVIHQIACPYIINNANAHVYAGIHTHKHRVYT